MMTLWLLGCTAAWLLVFWSGSRVLALAGAVCIVFSYAAGLAAQFMALWWVGRHDPAMRPGWGQLMRAWLVEALVVPRVFCWRQPFRWNAVPDHLAAEPTLHGRRGVVFVHGFVCNRGLWTPWLEQLKNHGHAFVAVNLEPVFGAIDEYVPLIEQAVEQVTRATGMAPLLVCHSMGGLAARAWLRACNADERVHHVITIGSPHHGTWLGRFSHVVNGRQMRLSSPWLQQLERDEPMQRRARFTCFYANCDNIVFPVASATLEGARNCLVAGVAHVALAFEPQVMRETLALL